MPEQGQIAPNERETLVSELISSFPILVAQLDHHYCVRFASEGYRVWFGIDPEQQVGRHIREIIGHEAFTSLEPWFNTALAGVQATYHGEVPYAHCGRRFIHGIYTPYYGAENEIIGLQIVVSDLTAYSSLRQQLADETLRTRTIVQHAIDGIITINSRGIIQSFNPAAQQLFGYSVEEVVGENVRMLMPEPYHSHHDGYIRHYQDTNERRIIGTGRDVTAAHRDGSTFEINLAVAEFFINQEQQFVGFIHDISSRKQAEQEAFEARENLSHANRITAMGELAAGLAHEISQPLTAIQATAEACRSLLASGNPDPDMLADAMEQIATQSQRTSDIIQEMRDFVRKDGPGHLDRHNPASLIDNILPLLSHALEKAGVSIDLLHETPACGCLVNRIQIEQVLFNIMRNAIEAMEDHDDERRLRIRSRMTPDGEHCEIEIEDTGPGIPEKHLERLFDPFFTTKAQGMGQGLPICKSIIENHGGHLKVTPPEAGGSLFRVFLPMEDQSSREPGND